MHLPPSRRIKGNEQLRRRKLPNQSPIKKSTQDHRGFLWTVAQALLLGPGPHERWNISLIFRCFYNLEMCWCAESLYKRGKKTPNTHQRQVGNVPPPLWKPCRGCLWGIRGQNSSHPPLHTGLNCLWRLMILTTLLQYELLLRFMWLEAEGSIMSPSSLPSEESKDFPPLIGIQRKCYSEGGRCSTSDTLILWEQSQKERQDNHMHNRTICLFCIVLYMQTGMLT